MPITSVSPHISIKTQPALEITTGKPSLLNLQQGETLTATIIEKTSINQYLINIKGVAIAAESDVNLITGQKYPVKVQGVHPQIVLNVMDGVKSQADAKIHEAVVRWRMNPDALVELQSKVAEFSLRIQSGDLKLAFSAKEVDKLLDHFRQIIFSSRSLKNHLFIKEFISRMGIMLESNLAKMASGQITENMSLNLTDNLKASLLKLSAAITDAIKDPSRLEAQMLSRAGNLANFVSEALQVIESRQAVNVLYQKNESGLYMQIPMELGRFLRQADIFIFPDNKKENDSKKYLSVNVLIFLDLDYLGDITIKASINKGHMRLMILCESDESKEVIDAASDSLKKTLDTAGYCIERMECIKAPDLKKKREDFVLQQVLKSSDLVDQFV